MVIEVIASHCGKPSINTGVAFSDICSDILICVFAAEFFLSLSKKIGCIGDPWLHNEHHQLSSRRQHPFNSSRLYGSGAQAGLSWVLCPGSYQMGSGGGCQCVFPSGGSGGEPICKLIRVRDKTQFLGVVGLKSSARDHSWLLEAACNPCHVLSLISKASLCSPHITSLLCSF